MLNQHLTNQSVILEVYLRGNLTCSEFGLIKRDLEKFSRYIYKILIKNIWPNNLFDINLNF